MSASVADRFQTALNLLAEWGFKTSTVAGWQTRKARKDITYDPAGIVNHHTGAWETKDDLLFRTGRTGLPAPLCQFAIQVDGTITLGAAGYANGAGINNKAAVEALIAGLGAEQKPGLDSANYSGNRRTISVEVKCPGSYNPAQRAAAVALNAALVLAMGWSTTKPPVGAHKEITRRKPGDPGDDMGKFRSDVVAFIASKTEPVPVPDPTPPPVVTPPAVVALLLGIANCQSYDGDKSLAAWTARGQLMKAQGRNAWCVCETSAAGREVLLANLGKTWVAEVLDGKEVAVLYDTAVWSARAVRSVSFGTAFGQGALAVPLYHKAGKVGFDVISQHTRPGSVATDAQKDRDIAAGAKLAGTWPAVIAGDFNRKDPNLPGWVRVTPNVDDLDAAFTHGPLTASHAKGINPGKLSDHEWLRVDITPTTVPTN